MVKVVDLPHIKLILRLKIKNSKNQLYLQYLLRKHIQYDIKKTKCHGGSRNVVHLECVQT